MFASFAEALQAKGRGVHAYIAVARQAAESTHASAFDAASGSPETLLSAVNIAARDAAFGRTGQPAA